MNDHNIFVFSQGRSGGSTLIFALNCLVPGVLTSESLNNHCPEVDQKVRLQYDDVSKYEIPHSEFQKEYKSILEDYLEQSEGLKHNITNFDFFGENRNYEGGLWFALDKMVINYFDKVIVNDRKNWLKWKISFVIAARLNFYGIDNTKQEKEYEELVDETDPFELDIEKIGREIKIYKEEWNKRIKYIENNDIDYMYFTYENVYNNPRNYRVRHFETLAQFLGFEDFEAKDTRVDHLFSDIRKVSGKNRNYGLVKNLDEINEELGPEHGYLY